MKPESEVLVAQFNPKVCAYWLLSGVLILTLTIFGIPLLLIWIPLGLFVTKRYLERMECVLTNKALKVKKGILVRVEKTIPLEKITDMGMVQGPIMRGMGLHTLTVETAGQSGTGALVSLTGIVDAPSFREAVLNQRDISTSGGKEVSEDASVNSSDTIGLLTEIRDTLVRIESKFDSAIDQSTRD